MLHRNRLTFTAHRIAKFGLPVFTVTSVAVAGLIRMPAKPEWGSSYAWIKSAADLQGWWLIIVASLLAAFCAWVQKRVGAPETWEILHSLLNGIRDHVFSQPEMPDYHRVTLFQSRWHKNRRDIFGLCRRIAGSPKKWLVPVVRSGHTSQETTTCFQIGDADAACQGVAGQAWFRNQMVSVSDLPDLAADASQTQIEAYASRTFVDAAKIQAKRPHARSLLAVPLLLKGELWGVLVFDSRNPARIDGTTVGTLFKMLSTHLSDIIEKIL
jgi:hypothetical protein